MYKTSFALASLLAFADALYLKSSCGPCCDGGDDDEPNEETQEVIDEFVEELDIEVEGGLIEEDIIGGEGMGEPCSVQADKFFDENGLTYDQLVDADLAIEKINFQYMNDLWSRQEANHWFNWLGKADQDDDDIITFDDLVDVCQLTYDESFFFEEAEDADYLRDHPLEDLVATMIDLLDMDKNDYININALRNVNLPRLLDEGTITQDEADMYDTIVGGALDTIDNDERVHRDVILQYLQDNYWYFDWQGEGHWMADTTE